MPVSICTVRRFHSNPTTPRPRRSNGPPSARTTCRTTRLRSPSLTAVPMRSRVRCLAAALAGGVVIVGCANVPDHGAVHPGNAVPHHNTGVDEAVRVIVHGRSPGDKPEDIVTGFLTASAGSETDHSVARSYLTLQAARAWQPNSRALVEDGTPSDAGPVRSVGPNRAVLFRFPLAATVGSDGGYTVAAH